MFLAPSGSPSVGRAAPQPSAIDFFLCEYKSKTYDIEDESAANLPKACRETYVYDPESARRGAFFPHGSKAVGPHF